jgi:hypothetical protein
MAKGELSSLMSTFYRYEEVADAKSLLFDFVKSIKVDYVPMFTERKGTNKIRATIDAIYDTLGLFTLLDVHKVELPCYVVMDIPCVPAIDSKIDVDLSVVATLNAMVNDLHQRVSILSDKVDILTSLSSATTISAPAFDVIQQPTLGVSSVVQHMETAPKTWAAQAASLASNITAFQPTIPSPTKSQRSVKMGSGQSCDEVKGLPRHLTCFVGRLDKDIMEEDLGIFLEDVGIKEVRRHKLDDKDGRCRISAFRMSCRETYKDLFYDESNWPEGVSLRNWTFRRRDGSHGR